jgi:hypothetical protein
MPITYTWTPTSLIGYPTFDGQTDVVTRAFYTVLGDDGEGHTADYSNFAYTPLDPSVPFIPYVDLTPEIVIGWVQSNLGPEAVAAIEESIAIVIQRQVTPPPEPEVLPLPWAPPVPPEAPAAEAPAAEAPAAEAPLIEPPAASEAPLIEAPAAAEAPLIEPPAPDLSAPVN